MYAVSANLLHDRRKNEKMIQRTGAAYKEQSGALSAATLDRAENAITYRVFGREKERQNAYEENLSAYEKSAVRANIWNTAMPPVYRVISMAGVLFILYFGQKNILGTGWRAWGIAAFTTFLSCFVKLSVKSSSAAKLFNAVHKAQVSWNRIKPLLTRKDERTAIEDQTAENHARECKEKTTQSQQATQRQQCKNTDQSSEFCLSGWKENFRRHLSFRRERTDHRYYRGGRMWQVNAWKSIFV